MANLQVMRISLVLRASIMAVALVGWMAAPALAAPTALSTNPEEGAEMHEPPGEVTVEFSEPLQSSSGMTVTDGCGEKVSEGDARITGTAMNELNVIVGDAPHAGTYKVEYVATGVSGTTSGEFNFVVHGGTGCDGSTGGHGGGGHNGGGQTGGGQTGGGHTGGGHTGGGHTGGGHNGGGTQHGTGGNHSGGGGSHTMGDGHKMSGESHDARNGHDMKGHNKGDKNRKHSNHKRGNRGGTNPPVAAPPNSPIATDIPTGGTVVIALSLAVLMGLIGGWVLRMSTPS